MKLKIISLMAITSIILQPIFTQPSYLKLIEKGKYAKAEKEINKSIKKEPDDVKLNYAMSILLIRKNYKTYNPPKAYEYIVKTKRLYENVTDLKESRTFEKIYLTDLSIERYKDTICRYGLENTLNLNTIEAYENYLNHYRTAPTDCRIIATDKRDSLAYAIAKTIHTINTYQAFIEKYPLAKQVKSAIENIHAIAFENAKSKNSIFYYEKFISDYPKANQVKDATLRINQLAFEDAQAFNTSIAYKSFMNKYPRSRQYDEALGLYEKMQFKEETALSDWISYKNFIGNFSGNSYIRAARDSIYAICESSKNIEAIKYCIDNFSGEQKKKAFLLYHDIFTDDGEKATLDLFYKEYDDASLNDVKIKDYELAELGDALNLHQSYSEYQFDQFDDYIKKAAPRERAFLALQKMLVSDLNEKNWQSILNKIEPYRIYFGSEHKKLNNLINILQEKWDATLKIKVFGPEINTEKGGEYSPVISADDKYIYFCGRKRSDNVGGEDIFVSSLKPPKPAKIITDLSNSFSNDAPVSLSTDGTTMILFESGDLFTSDKMIYGWSTKDKIKGDVNAGEWQADAVVSSDGNAMFFATIREENLNYYTTNPDHYHGGQEFASDIYVCIKNEFGEWGSAINLGSIINTPYNDRSPFLHPDMKTLYFSSSGHGGIGELDVFKSTRLSDTCWTCWSEPINLGKEINTTSNDWGYKISTDGNRAYFAKGRDNNENDIFWLNLPPKLRPDYIATISGQLLDKNNKPIAAEIRWEDLQTGKNVGQSKSDPTDGSYFIVLPLGKIYGYYVDKDEYFPISNNLDLRNSNKAVKIENNINIVTFQQMIDEGIAVPINNLFFDFGKYDLLPYSIPELKRVAGIIKINNLKVEISGHTDNIGNFSNNQILSEQRANAVKTFLIDEGCDESLLTTIGYGKSKPVASNDTEEGRAKNRRVELKFIK